MCLGIPGRIVSIDESKPDVALVDVRGSMRLINIGIVVPDNPTTGSWVDVHLGMAVGVLDEEEAKASLAFLDELEEAVARAVESPETA